LSRLLFVSVERHHHQEGLRVQKYFTVSEIARRLGAPPRDISDLFYQRKLDDEACPIVGGRRLIPSHYLPAIEAALRDQGREGGAACPS
jgi:hypothetical protein